VIRSNGDVSASLRWGRVWVGATRERGILHESRSHAEVVGVLIAVADAAYRALRVGGVGTGVLAVSRADNTANDGTDNDADSQQREEAEVEGLLVPRLLIGAGRVVPITTGERLHLLLAEARVRRLV
jgi:hypothetical protein